MSTAESVRTFSDLYTDLLNRAREATGVTATTNIAKRYINTALLDMHQGNSEKLPWAERRSHVITQPRYTTGTVAITKGATAVTGDGNPAWATANDFGVNNVRVGGKMTIAGGQEVYTVSAVGSNTSITLTEKFVGTTQTAGSYVYFEDAYALAPDFLRPVDWRSFGEGWEIPLIGRTEFRRRYPRNNVTGTITVGTIIDDDMPQTSGSITVMADAGTTPSQSTITSASHGLANGDVVTISGTTNYNGVFTVNNVTADTFEINLAYPSNDDGTGTWINVPPTRKIVFHRPPQTAQLIPYSYITSMLAVTASGSRIEQMSADTDEPIVPYRYRTAIVLRALHIWYRDRKDDARSQEVLAEYSGFMDRILGDHEVGDARPKFQPMMAPYRRRARRPYTRSQQRYDINGRFDRMER